MCIRELSRTAPVISRPAPSSQRVLRLASFWVGRTQIWSLKKDAANVDKKKPKVSAAQIRLQKVSEPHGELQNPVLCTRRDLSELELPKTMQMTFPQPDDLLNFELVITPDEGFYKAYSFRFTFAINNNYPHDPPKVRCTQKIYHPNIDLDGNVCLNILREDWKPVLSLNSVVVGLQYLFLEPNPDDPLNKTAAEDLRSSRRSFENNVRSACAGRVVNGVKFDKLT
ncbi:MAG: ubiquitin-conjugating enzyme/RWD-like protein [Olpidium bornovanus]|uniref:NEDD8-conjugating enzyme UBC12 n=1 Tax=Olpidium bornovanus TaxID=278681 RepID=A0A8H8A0P9_9FUNG|nr:MAG: ubiquitin-conjugating enzyme/RWD-like protein [Olpidium bornovanus]